MKVLFFFLSFLLLLFNASLYLFVKYHKKTKEENLNLRIFLWSCSPLLSLKKTKHSRLPGVLIVSPHRTALFSFSLLLLHWSSSRFSFFSPAKLSPRRSRHHSSTQSHRHSPQFHSSFPHFPLAFGPQQPLYLLSCRSKRRTGRRPAFSSLNSNGEAAPSTTAAPLLRPLFSQPPPASSPLSADPASTVPTDQPQQRRPQIGSHRHSWFRLPTLPPPTSNAPASDRAAI